MNRLLPWALGVLGPLLLAATAVDAQAPPPDGGPDAQYSQGPQDPNAGPDGYPADQPYDANPSADDPPDRAARLSFVQGDVSLQPEGGDDWTTAVINRPLTTGDRLWTDRDARAEVQTGPAAVRISSNTGFSFLNIDDDTIQMRVTAGVVDVRLRTLDENDHVEIDTPNLALSLLRPGHYRVEVNDEGDSTVVKVSEGEAEATGGTQNVIVHNQQRATFTGTDQLASNFGTLGAPDSFDSWSLERDRLYQAPKSAQYVSEDVVGYEDLDRNGSWSSEPEYGNVWTPTAVAVDWSPYRYGHWVWVSPWGWTWVDDAAWGFAPFHYGRWAHVRDRWCWVPGPRHVRAVYAPALVGWVGNPGASVTVAVGGGGVAWFPLGPREVYVPAYRVSPRYVQRVNVTNTVVNNTYITNVYTRKVTNINYRNRVVPGGVTAVSRTTFVSAQPVGRHTIRVDERQVTRVQATTAAPNFRPGRESVLGAEAGRRNVRIPPAAVVNREVVARRAPPPASAKFVRGADRRGQDNSEAMTDRLRRMQNRQDGEVANRGRDSEPANRDATIRNGDGGQASREARDRNDARSEALAKDQAIRDQASRERAVRDMAQRDRGERDSAAARERQAQQQDRIQREAEQQQQRGQQNAQLQQERAQRENQQAQERAQRDAQRQALERDNSQRQAQQQQERAQREARNQQDRVQRNAQMQQERAQRDAQLQQERSQRDAQQQQERSAQQQQERAAQQQQQRAQREAERNAEQSRRVAEAASANAQRQERERASRPEPQARPQQQNPQQQNRPEVSNRGNDRRRPDGGDNR